MEALVSVRPPGPKSGPWESRYDTQARDNSRATDQADPYGTMDRVLARPSRPSEGSPNTRESLESAVRGTGCNRERFRPESGDPCADPGLEA